MLITIFKVILPLVVTFIIGVLITPFFSNIMYKHRLWKRSARGNKDENPEISDAFAKIHDDVSETSTPRIGGIIVWVSVLMVSLLLWFLPQIIDSEFLTRLDFISRSQTWIPLAALLIASLVGLMDDLLQIFGKGLAIVDGLTRYQRVAIIASIGLVVGWWFFDKLDMVTIAIPFFESISIGVLMIPFVIIVMLATFSGGVIDGIDGLSGGVLAAAFAAYAMIAFLQNQIDIAALSAAITGGILAFLWFNIPPARFYMGETGMMGLTVTLTIIAFLTDHVLLLIIIALPLAITSASVIIQKASRALRNGKRVFRVAPLHHHLQSIGWSSEKITMRYWIISLVCALAGVIIALIG